MSHRTVHFGTSQDRYALVICHAMTHLYSKLACIAALSCYPTLAASQTLGAAQDFAIVAGSQITAAVGAVPSQIVGDVGLSPGEWVRIDWVSPD